MMGERRIAFRSSQKHPSDQRSRSAHVVLTIAEAEKLERALRLAREGKLGVERRVPLDTVEVDAYVCGEALKTTLSVKAFEDGVIPECERSFDHTRR